MKRRVRAITRRSGGQSLRAIAAELRGYLVGWKAYFQLTETPGVFDQLDHWIYRRLRVVQLKHWKRGPTIYHELRKLGIPDWQARIVAAYGRHYWRTSANPALRIALPPPYFAGLGVPRLAS